MIRKRSRSPSTTTTAVLLLLVVISPSSTDAFANYLLGKSGCWTDLSTDEAIMGSLVIGADDVPEDEPQLRIVEADSQGGIFETITVELFPATFSLQVLPAPGSETPPDYQFAMDTEPAEAAHFEKGGCDDKKRISGTTTDTVEITVTAPNAKVWAGWAAGHEAVRLTPVVTFVEKGAEAAIEADAEAADEKAAAAIAEEAAKEEEEGEQEGKAVDKGDTTKEGADSAGGGTETTGGETPPATNATISTDSAPAETAKEVVAEEKVTNWTAFLLAEATGCQLQHIVKGDDRMLEEEQELLNVFSGYLPPIADTSTDARVKLQVKGAVAGSIPAQVELQWSTEASDQPHGEFEELLLESSTGASFEAGACEGQRVNIAGGALSWPPMTIHKNRDIFVWGLYSVSGDHQLYRTEPLELKWTPPEQQTGKEAVDAAENAAPEGGEEQTEKLHHHESALERLHHLHEEEEQKGNIQHVESHHVSHHEVVKTRKEIQREEAHEKAKHRLEALHHQHEEEGGLADHVEPHHLGHHHRHEDAQEGDPQKIMERKLSINRADVHEQYFKDQIERARARGRGRGQQPNRDAAAAASGGSADPIGSAASADQKARGRGADSRNTGASAEEFARRDKYRDISQDRRRQQFARQFADRLKPKGARPSGAEAAEDAAQRRKKPGPHDHVTFQSYLMGVGVFLVAHAVVVPLMIIASRSSRRHAKGRLNL